MDFSTALICIAATTFAACYAWGMRGAVIGGEKGAMLPGAFIGLALAWFSGGEIRESFWIPAAAGAMGMTFGGTEPYGETIGMVLHRGRPDYNPKKGYAGLAFKGALWFSVCGGFLGISFASMTGKIYDSGDLIVFCVLIPLLGQIGYKLFNLPYDKKNGIYPKIFFSLTRREEWGSNVILALALVVMAAVKGDWFTLSMIASGFVFGAIGWLVGMKGFVLVSLPLKNGKNLFEKAFKKGIIDGWKLMEFVLGAFGGFGLSLAFCLNFAAVEKYNSEIVSGGRAYINENLNKLIPLVVSACILGILAINIYQFICGKKNKKVDYFFWDRIERPLYNVIPMALVLLGSELTAKIMTVFFLVFGCSIKCAFDRFEDSKLLPLGQAVVGLICAAVFTGCFFEIYSPFILVFAGTVPYMVTEFASALWANKRKGKNFGYLLSSTAFATVYPTFIVQCVIVLIISWKIFGI